MLATFVFLIVYADALSSEEKKEAKRVEMMRAYLIVSLIELIFHVWGLARGITCNRTNKIGYGILGFLFGDLYLLQSYIRQYGMKEAGYCCSPADESPRCTASRNAELEQTPRIAEGRAPVAARTRSRTRAR